MPTTTRSCFEPSLVRLTFAQQRGSRFHSYSPVKGKQFPCQLHPQRDGLHARECVRNRACGVPSITGIRFPASLSTTPSISSRFWFCRARMGTKKGFPRRVWFDSGPNPGCDRRRVIPPLCLCSCRGTLYFGKIPTKMWFMPPCNSQPKWQFSLSSRPLRPPGWYHVHIAVKKHHEILSLDPVDPMFFDMVLTVFPLGYCCKAGTLCKRWQQPFRLPISNILADKQRQKMGGKGTHRQT